MAKRRPNGGGTITKRTDGRYQGAAYVTTTEGVRVRRFVYGATYDAVAEKLGKLQEGERNGIPVPARSWKVGAYLSHWLDEIVKPNKEYNTYAKYESKVRLYLVPHLGPTSLTRLTPGHVRLALASMEREGVPAPTRQEVLRVLRNALNRARREELVLRNVAELVDMPKAARVERKPWTAEEAIAFLRAARAHRLYAACVLLLALGLRRGEILGLRWQDVDFQTEQFTPTKQVQRQEGRLVLKDLKTNSSQAALPLPKFCVDALRERQDLQDLERRIAGDDWHQAPGADLIFSERHGGMIEPRGFSRTFEALVKRAGVRQVTVRLARHTCGTLLAFLKVHPRVAKAILRHSQISMTMDVYTHVVDEDQRKAADRLAALLEGDELLG
jgi:integrase